MGFEGFAISNEMLKTCRHLTNVSLYEEDTLLLFCLALCRVELPDVCFSISAYFIKLGNHL